MVELKMFIPRMPHRQHSELALALVAAFGGVTLMPSIGMWNGPDPKQEGKTITHVEGVDVMLCYIPDTDEARLRIEELARRYKADANQISVLFSIAGKPTFIED